MLLLIAGLVILLLTKAVSPDGKNATVCVNFMLQRYQYIVTSENMQQVSMSVHGNNSLP